MLITPTLVILKVIDCDTMYLAQQISCIDCSNALPRFMKTYSLGFGVFAASISIKGFNGLF